MRIINNIKALHKGEITEKIKRFVLKKSKTIGLSYRLPKKIKFEYVNYFKVDKRKFEHLKIKISENFILMNKRININNIVFNEKERLSKWHYTNLPKDTDIKFIWEINRLQFLPLMAIDYLCNKNKVKLDKITTLIDKWQKDNPYDYGINWYSNLEIAIRSISILLTYILIYEEYTSKTIEKLLFQHAYHIYKDIYYTEKCIPNNHVIGEATTLYILGNIIKSEYSKKWVKKSKKILKEYLNYFQNDGTYIEASLSYHRFALQMYLLVYLFSKKFNDNFISNELENTFSNSYYFLKTIEKPDRTYPQFGDWDNGIFYKLDFEEVTNYKSFVDTLGYFLGLNKPTFQSIALESIFEKVLIDKKVFLKEGMFLFKDGKYVVIKDKSNYIFINNQKQIYHSHSDGLSLEITIDAKNITVDSGTYSYNLDKKLRFYFRSTRAHNTVYLGKDQAKQIGTFRWINPPKTFLNVMKRNNIYIIKGRLEAKNKKNHNRKVIYNKENKDIVIIDEIRSDEYEINWHFNPELNITKIMENKYLIDGDIYILIFSKQKNEISLKKSYYSPSYNVLLKRNNLVIKKMNEKKENIIYTIFTKNKNFNGEALKAYIKLMEEI